MSVPKTQPDDVVPLPGRLPTPVTADLVVRGHVPFSAIAAAPDREEILRDLRRHYRTALTKLIAGMIARDILADSKE